MEQEDPSWLGPVALAPDGGAFFQELGAALRRVGAEVVGPGAPGAAVLVAPAARLPELIGPTTPPNRLAVVGNGAHRDALRRGATATIDPDVRLADAVRVVASAQRGLALVPSTVLVGLARSTRERPCRCEGASPEQLAIARHLASGASMTDAAAALDRCERDCYRQLARLKSLLRARTRVEVVAHLVACDRLASWSGS